MSPGSALTPAAQRVKPPLMMIYKVFRPAELAALGRDGETPGAPIDVADGYIHFSTAGTLPETLRLHFARAGDLVLVACETEALGQALRWDPSRGGILFPHLYRPLRLSDVVWQKPLPQVDGGHPLPDPLP